MRKDPSSLARLELLMGQQSSAAAQIANATQGRINRVLVPRLYVDSRFSL